MRLSNPPSFWLLLTSVYTFMGFCSVVGALHPKLRGTRGKPIREAINSWWPPALVAGAAVSGGMGLNTAIFAGISLWTLHEYLLLRRLETRHGVIQWLAYAAVPAHYFLLATDIGPFGAGLVAWTFVVLPLAWLLRIGPGGIFSVLPRIQWGIVLTVGALSYVTRVTRIEPGLAAFLLLCVMSNDAAQYVFGKLWGRRRLAPNISPNKTWEGMVGGILTTVAVAIFAGAMVTPFNPIQSATIGAGLAIAGVLGDLLISSVKRDAGVKDTGSVLPQHGGVLDRCDSLLLAAPLYFYGLRIWLA
jgi:phosphatidate cytidylyltransferase